MLEQINKNNKIFFSGFWDCRTCRHSPEKELRAKLKTLHTFVTLTLDVTLFAFVITFVIFIA